MTAIVLPGQAPSNGFDVSQIRSSAYASAGRSLYASRVSSLLGRQRPVVLAFHRVNWVTSGDSMTCSPPLFDAICRFLKQHFEVMPLGQLVELFNSGRPPKRQALAITFDDGYRDNYDVALPILLEHALPATFFVTSDFVDSVSIPNWDRKLFQPQAWMNWSQVREMASLGFDIGAHTRKHVDLGRIHGRRARKEIVGSRERLQDETGQAVQHFAYPFGGPTNITPDNRRRVQDAGFVSCSSCHGGINTLHTDPFHIQRVPVANWYQSPYHLGLAIKSGRA